MFDDEPYHHSKTVTSWPRRFLLACDRLLNVIVNGNPDLTISTRAAIARQEGRRWGCVVCRVLDFFAKDHCANSLPPKR